MENIHVPELLKKLTNKGNIVDETLLVKLCLVQFALKGKKDVVKF